MKRIAIVLLLAASWMSGSFAQTYPVKPVRMIVNYPPGGPTDLVGRLTAQYLTEVLGQQVVVENRGGAGGTVGASVVVKSPPDGHTLTLAANGEIAIAPNLYAKLPYDPRRDLAPISRIGMSQLLLVVHPSVPARSVKELVAMARAKPGVINFASAGTGSTAHLCGELLKSLAKIDIVHVPYKGAGPALSELMGGQVEMLIAPDLPVIGETVPGYQANSWYGVLAPAGTPQPIIDRLYGELAKMVQRPDVKDRFAGLGIEPEGTTPARFAEQMREEIALWGKVVKAAGVKVE
jgi:tripartite-type tricarboxylate transporter receptor subunit TctC